MIRIGPAIAMVLLSGGTAVRAGECPAPGQPRTFQHGVFTSPDLPAMQIRVDSTFRYAGRVPIRIRDLAAGERHLFVDADGMRIRRLLILQFEGFLPGTSDIYRYRARDPVSLGGLEFGHGTFAFNVAQEVARNPGVESDSTRAVLTRAGYVWPDEQMTSRFARIVDQAHRHELLIFYHEEVAATGHTLQELADDDGAIRPAFADLAARLTQRSLAAFAVLEPCR